MWHLAANHDLRVKGLTVVLAIVIGLISTGLLLQATAQKANAQTASTTMSQLLSQLYAEKQQIAFRFVVPLIANENIWVVPNESTDPNNDISITIDQIEEDHICFLRRGGEAYDEICTPFSNVASFSYLNMPK